MTCYLIVKSDTKLVDREKFDSWYEKEHLSEARQAFMAKSAKRGWIKDTNFHLAIYEFESMDDAEKASNSQSLKVLIRKFDQKWDYKVNRTRELAQLMQII